MSQNPDPDLLQYADTLRLFNPLMDNPFGGQPSDPLRWFRFDLEDRASESALLMLILHLIPNLVENIRCKEDPACIHQVTISTDRTAGRLGSLSTIQSGNCGCSQVLFRLPRKHVPSVLQAWDRWQHRYDRDYRFMSLPLASPEPGSLPDPAHAYDDILARLKTRKNTPRVDLDSNGFPKIHHSSINSRSKPK
ncbi:hypothetical protein K435DRAFT_860293 [Dendrothele bispora CBS 962.96]|uniref:Uncharacterized protein n=1 Tax=Dendrothele bispora (strain CBS 962.96) TaxID=1314807 RepID=A0A4S8LY63_DENBC|nr:hypothetical protein K435DRAFT_860293 [Dendrothele bispora CBS 962.96]